MIETSSVPSRKSSVIFGKCPKNVQKRSSYLRKNLGKSLEIFGNWSQIFGKSSKTSSLVCLRNKQNITWPLVDMNFIFSCSTQHLTHSLRSLVRYWVQHSKIKFISMRGHVISSIYTFLETTKGKNSFSQELHSSENSHTLTGYLQRQGIQRGIATIESEACCLLQHSHRCQWNRDFFHLKTRLCNPVKIHTLTCEFHVKFHLKTDNNYNHHFMIYAMLVFHMKFNMEFPPVYYGEYQPIDPSPI